MKKNIAEILKGFSKAATPAETPMATPVVQSVQTYVADPQITELLTFYMRQCNDLTSEMSDLKAKLTIKEAENNELVVINAAMKTSLTAAKKKISSMERRIAKLTAVEKVWKETISKLQLTTQSTPAPAFAMASATIGDGIIVNDFDSYDGYMADHEALLEGIEGEEDC